MSGIQFDGSRRSIPSVFSLFLLLTGVALCIWVGPKTTLLAAVMGLAFACVALLQQRKVPANYRRTLLPWCLSGFHVFLLITATVLQLLFLTPLPSHTTQVPRFQYYYEDPEGLFRLRGPNHWRYTRLARRDESGVRCNPEGRENYMGVAELTVVIRRLETIPQKPEQFLERMAALLASGSAEKKGNIFNFSMRPATTMSQTPAVFATLDVKRFWLPLRQVTLLSIKNSKYLCSVSATGLQTHARLSEVLCLGVLEGLQIHEGHT